MLNARTPARPDITILKDRAQLFKANVAVS